MYIYSIFDFVNLSKTAKPHFFIVSYIQKTIQNLIKQIIKQSIIQSAHKTPKFIFAHLIFAKTIFTTLTAHR